MVKITPEISNKISNLGILCAFMVVIIHIPKCAIGHNAFMYRVFPDCFLGAAVPMFFVISGFLIGGHTDANGWWKRELAKRWSSLVIPYLVLNTFFFVGFCAYKVLIGVVVHVLDYLNALGIIPGENSNNPIVGPLWYVRCLILAVITLPIYMPFIRKSRLVAGLAIAMFIVGGTLLGDAGGFIFSSVYRLWGVGYFLLGVALRIYGIPTITRKVGIACALMAWVLSLVMEFGFAGNTEVTKMVVKFMLIIGLWGWVAKSVWSKVLTRNSFAIYAMHGIITLSAWIVVDKIGLYKRIFGSPITYYLAPILLIGGIILVSEFLRRRLPRLAKIILGGR